MKRVIRWIVGLYPARWRRRYGVEFDDLLEDIRPGWRDLFDLLRGALEMQIAMGTFGKILAVFGVSGALIAGAVSLTLPDRYRSSVLVRVQKTQGVTADAYHSELDGLLRDVLDHKSLVGIMERERLYERERASKPVDDVINKMRNDISIKLMGSDALRVSFDGSDAARARETANALADTLIETALHRAEDAALHRAEAGTLATTILQRFEILERPTMPQRPVRPNRIAMTGFGLCAGLLFGVFAALVRRAPLTSAP